LETIHPQYIILKPSLLGGFKASEDWISEANSLGIEWWITSALESNVGLNALAQWTYTLSPKGPQGLGTGSLFKNNIQCPLTIQKACLGMDNSISWDLI
jgi:O-succinylbenzoate synthase